MKSLLLPTYFPSISSFAALVQADGLLLETDDNFQKQTNRNRMYIYSPNGVQLLNIPIKHSGNQHQKTRDVRLETAFDWQKQHFKSLEAAYRSSPFFEYFEDDFVPFFTKRHTFLLDLTLESMDLVARCLRYDLAYDRTEEFFKVSTDVKDYRGLANGKKDNTALEPYTQVFEDKCGFLPNLSVLDLLFNEGRHALDYLKRQSV